MYQCSTKGLFLLFYTEIDLKKIVAAFRGMHVSPAKHSFGKCDRRTDGQTDGQTDRQGQSDPYVSLCFAGDTKINEIMHCWIFQELMPDIKEIKPSEPVLDFGNEDEKIFDNEEDVRDVKIRRTVVSGSLSSIRAFVQNIPSVCRSSVF